MASGRRSSPRPSSPSKATPGPFPASSLDGRLLDALARRHGPVAPDDLLRAARIAPDEREAAHAALTTLEERGHIVGVRGGRLTSAAAQGFVPGTLTMNPSGFAFVRTDDPQDRDVFVSRTSIGSAMHGDRVLVRLARPHRGRPTGRGRTRTAPKTRQQERVEGEVERVLARAVTTVVGTFRPGRRTAVVMPRDPRLLVPIVIPRGAEGDAREDDVVIATITKYPGPRTNAEARIDEVLGQASDPRVDTEAVMAHFGLPRAFPPVCEEHARRVARTVEPEAIAGRDDLRGMPLVTIDGETARDFDDAVYVERLEKGFRATIAIADVAHYVQLGSPIDLEARARGTSVYFPDRVVPMLPEALSNGICSLNPDVDRLVLAVTIGFDARGRAHETHFAEAVMRSRARLTYTRVREALVDRDPAVREGLGDLLPMIEAAEALARQCMARRRTRGAIDFDLPEPEIVVDAQGRAIDVRRAERSIANQLIEELMLAANEAVARELMRRDLGFLHRVHEPPPPDAVATLQRYLEGFGLHLTLEDGQLTPRAVQRMLEQAADRPEVRLLHAVLLRSMQQARYAPESLGHFGLATATYCHFTSPIRRYPDLIVHRILKGALHAARAVPADLTALGAETSKRERVAMEAERDVVALKRAQVMQQHVGASFAGHVTGVTAFGLFVELDRPFVDGLVHVSSLDDDFYEHDPDRHCLRGRRTGRTIRIGDPVRVRCIGVSIERRGIDFVLEDHTCTVRRSRRS